MEKKNNINFKLYSIYLISILIPFFIYLDGSIYFEKLNTLNEKNIIFSTPIPISIFSSLLILIFIIYKNKKLFFNIKIIKILFACSIINLIIILSKGDINLKKIVYFIQFIIPWLGLLIAYNIKNEEGIFKIIFYFLSFLVTLQLLITIFKGKLILISDIYFFSVYQNIQYVSSIYVMLAAIVSINLYKKNKFKIILFNLIVLIYVLLTYSLSSIIIYILFLLVAVFYCFYKSSIQLRIKYVLIFVVSLIIFAHNFSSNQIHLDKSKFIFKKNYYENFQKFEDIKNFKIPKNFEKRMIIWKDYYDEIKSNKNIIFFGSQNYELDETHKSAHNLILDIIYKFGFTLVITYLLLFLIIKKKILYFKNQKQINNFLSLFLILIISIIENMFKVSLKQPYPGLISFYLIGYYLKKK